VDSTLMSLSDPAMPFLERALDRADAEKTFAQLPQHRGMGLHVDAAKLIRHKRGRRALIEYALSIVQPDGSTRSIVLLGKIRAKGVDHKTVRATESLAAEFERNEPPFIFVPGCYGVARDYNMWLQEKVHGEPLEKFLGGADAEKWCVRAVEAAFKVHRSSVVPSRTHTLADELRILNERLALVATARPDWESRIRKLAADCARISEQMSPGDACPVHRDFHLGQILIDPPRLWLLDFDLFSRGDPAVDIGNFIAHLTELSLRRTNDARSWQPLEQAVEDAYVALTGESVRPRIRVYALLTLARHVFISTQFEDRRPFTEALLNLCESRVSAWPNLY
jgi:hypothetical protein